MVFTMAITEGDDVSAQAMRTWFGDFGAEFVKTGFEVTEGTGLNAAVSAGTAYYFDSSESSYYGTWGELGLYAANQTDLLTHSLISPTKTFDNTKTMTVYYVIEF